MNVKTSHKKGIKPYVPNEKAGQKVLHLKPVRVQHLVCHKGYNESWTGLITVT